MRGKSIGVIADLLGRSDTYEFNRLLHEHTSYSQVGFFQISANAAIPEEIIRIALRDLKPKVQLAGICIDCVKEDIESLGFPYWRRDHCVGKEPYS